MITDIPRCNERYFIFEDMQELDQGGQSSIKKVQSVDHKQFIYKSFDEEKYFNSEINALMRLDHPNIVKATCWRVIEVENSFQYDSESSSIELQYALVLPFLKNGSIHTNRPKSMTLVRKWTKQLLNAVRYMHKQGIIHHDIKPGNLLRNDADDLILIDFGYATPESQVSLAGTRFTMAPEVSGSCGFEDMNKDGSFIINGARNELETLIHTGVDWFSVGITLWFFLTMLHLGKNGREMSLMEQHPIESDRNNNCFLKECPKEFDSEHCQLVKALIVEDPNERKFDSDDSFERLLNIIE